MPMPRPDEEIKQFFAAVMPGKPMKEYVTIPEQWHEAPDTITAWIEKSLQWVAAMPEKVPAKKKPSTKKKKDV
ncbi:hypothetical protein [Paenibacillus alginolyticus]|uniref:Uncharacterized protein n=1 Tax=Paenibacillus alginolyticus TaxID=59839 RepID=A0ABT4GMG5_9BACL|nr:hypothetical protein [Paenibacillus alginolyticus]MCY9697411.1 hypothetical protein [Paenibacillus alginolyticus]MEC0141887.1 hypothetical protein [Paenibacillus alginolyticus]